MTGRTHRGHAGRPGSAARLTEGDLRRLVRRVLAEGTPPPDEPGVSSGEAMGQYLMPDTRLDQAYHLHVKERDTDLERKFSAALYYQYARNDPGHLEKIWPEVWRVAQSGLYSRWLQPPAGSTAYRVIGGLSPDVAAQITGLPVEEIRESPGRAWRVEGSPPISGRHGQVSSWTLRPTPKLIAHFGISGSAAPNTCTLLVAARCEPGGGGGGQFLMNPRSFSKDFYLGHEFKSEAEVIAYGPIEVEELSYIYYDDRAFKRRRWTEDAERLRKALGL
jgi:hypothetical protein